MKIAFFTDTYHPSLNGVTVSLDVFSEYLGRKGHEVVFFAPKVKGYREKNKNVFRISSIKLLSSEPEVRIPLPTSGQIIKEIANQDFDIVHAHGNGPFSLLGYQIARVKGVPYVLTFHNLHTKYTHYFLKGKVVKPRMIATGMRVFANICDAIIVPSLKMKLELQSYGVKKDIFIIPNFVTLGKFKTENAHFLHTLLSLSPATPLILSVGRLGIEKNFTFLIHAFSEVALINPAVELVIIGKGPEKENLKKLVTHLKLTERVHFVESVSPSLMPQVYSDAELFVFPSVSETQGLCVLEAASSGLPLVVADDLAFDRIVVDKQNGYVLPLRTKIFSKAILELLSDSSLRKKMGKASHEISSKNFNGVEITNSLVEVYKFAFEKHKSSRKFIKKVNSVALSQIVLMKRNIDKILN